MSRDDDVVIRPFPKKPRKGFVRKAANVILATDYPPLRETVPGFLPEGLAFLAGRAKLGKTWLALNMATAVASGTVAMGSILCDQGDVLYLDLENGERRVKRRLEMLFPEDQERPDLSRIEFAAESPMLGPDFIQHLEEWRQSVERPLLVVVDVLQRIKPAGSMARTAYENDYAILTHLQQWATLHGITVLCLHHTKKGGADDPLEALSGSNGLAACADTTLVLDRDGNGTTLYVRGRDVEEREAALRFDAGQWWLLGDVNEIRRSDERKRVLDLLMDATEAMSPAEIAAALGTSPNTVRQLLFKMVKAGEVLKHANRPRYYHPDRPDLGPTSTGGAADD